MHDEPQPWNPDEEREVEPALPLQRLELGNLKPATFLLRVAASLDRQMGATHQDFHHQARSRLVQFWIGPDRTVHYELWVHERTAQLELGLHLESSPARNKALYRELDKCLLEIQAGLGPTLWLEEWDHGWVRLYETVPLWPLDDARVEQISERLSEIISFLQPLLRSLEENLRFPQIASTRR
jgi:hypothetical protein